MTTIDLDPTAVEAFAGQVAGILTGGATTAMMVVGDRLGLYAALAAHGPMTAAQLAERTGTLERPVREWLCQQNAAGILDHVAAAETFALAPEKAAVLASDDSPAGLIGAAPLVTGLHRGIDRLTQSFRTGAGIPWGEQDPTVLESTERFFGTGYRGFLVPQWVPALDGVHAALTRGIRVADIGCGHGVPLLLLAEAFPASQLVGFDIDPGSVRTARRRIADAGLADRVTAEVASAADFPGRGYGLITFFDVLHDLGDPTGAAVHAREALAPDGAVMIVEPRAGDDLDSTVATIPMAALSFAASTALCVPNALSQPGGAALGSQAGAKAVREILATAGFSRVRRAADTPFHTVLEARP